jgi:hypothetical protein
MCLKWRPFQKFLKGISDSLENAQRVLKTFPAILTERWIHLGKCPNKSRDPMGAFHTGSLANRKQEDPPQPIACLHIFKTFFILSNLIKDQRLNRKIFKPSAVLLLFFLFSTIPLLANINLLRLSL